MNNLLSIDFDPTGIDGWFDGIKDAAKKAIRPAIYTAAKIAYDEVKQQVPVSGKGHWFHGTSFKVNGTKYWFESGTLRDSIYHVYSKDNSVENSVADYQVGWNHKKCPYGFMVEYGTSKHAATPFLSTAWDHVHVEAEEAAIANFYSLVQEAISQ